MQLIKKCNVEGKIINKYRRPHYAGQRLTRRNLEEEIKKKIEQEATRKCSTINQKKIGKQQPRK